MHLKFKIQTVQNAPLIGVALVSCLPAGFALRKVRSDGGSSRGNVALEASARLLRLEALLQGQAGQVAELGKQFEKLQLRVRLVSTDFKRPLQQVTN